MNILAIREVEVNSLIEGLLVGLDEAEPLDLRYQAEPGNELGRS